VVARFAVAPSPVLSKAPLVDSEPVEGSRHKYRAERERGPSCHENNLRKKRCDLIRLEHSNMLALRVALAKVDTVQNRNGILTLGVGVLSTGLEIIGGLIQLKLGSSEPYCYDPAGNNLSPTAQGLGTLWCLSHHTHYLRHVRGSRCSRA
jgi:hypothetical protein